MPARYINIDRNTPMLLPSDLRDWVGPEHIVHFIIEAVESFSLEGFHVNHRGSGSAQYPPGFLLTLLIYSYATGRFSSRQIEQSTYYDVAVRYLCAGEHHPDHDTLCTFRRKNKAAFERVFVEVLELAVEMKHLKSVGTVSVDGTKIKANASRHSAVSDGYAQRCIERLEQEVQALLAKAEDADSKPLRDGLSVPDEIKRRETRQAQLKQARAIIKARHDETYAAKKAAHDEKVKEREAQRAAGKKPRGREPKAPSAEVPPNNQYNYTDPQSRIMKTGNGFEQCYNAQAGVEVESMLITGNYVSAHTNDKLELLPNIEASTQPAFRPDKVLGDTGYYSEDAIIKAQQAGVEVYCALSRQRHGMRVEDLEQPTKQAPLPEKSSLKEQMLYRLKSESGRALYKLRKQTVEPVFGTLKQTLGFRQFLTRGLASVGNEWNLACIAYNLKRLNTLTKTFPSGAVFSTQAKPG